MKIAICIDKNGGVLFCGRRVSQDSVLREKLISLLPDQAVLCMSPYSAKQFETGERIVVAENFLELAEDRDICFIEDAFTDLDTVSTVYLFQWNRLYPADTFFEFDPDGLGYQKTKTEDFEGSSHKKITLTIYERK